MYDTYASRIQIPEMNPVSLLPLSKDHSRSGDNPLS